jgi:hypothetical protein
MRPQGQDCDFILIQRRLAPANGVEVLDEVHAPNQRS